MVPASKSAVMRLIREGSALDEFETMDWMMLLRAVWNEYRTEYHGLSMNTNS